MEVLDFLKRNYEWIFSGIGVSIIGAIIAFIIGRIIRERKSINQVQKIGNGSRGIQVAGNYTKNQGKISDSD